MPIELSVVVPAYNEESNIRPLWERLHATLQALTIAYEVVFVNDGSTDGTMARLLEVAAGDRAVRIIELSRNFGKEAALTCGLAHARGQAVVLMDADLQHPPELLPELVARWRDGFEMVYAVRHDRSDQDALSRWFTWAFYWLFDKLADVRLPPDAGDFRLLDRQVVDALATLPERSRFMKGIFAWIGFRTAGVEFTVAERGGGATKFRPWRKLVLALDALTAFSNLPLRVWALAGAGISALGFIYILFRLVHVLVYGIDVPGYETLLAATLFLGGMQLLSLGVIGDYLGRVFQEAKHRPLYIVRGSHGGEHPPP